VNATRRVEQFHLLFLAQLARFYQIDNKLDSVVRADVAKQIPLAP